MFSTKFEQIQKLIMATCILKTIDQKPTKSYLFVNVCCYALSLVLIILIKGNNKMKRNGGEMNSLEGEYFARKDDPDMVAMWQLK